MKTLQQVQRVNFEKKKNIKHVVCVSKRGKYYESNKPSLLQGLCLCEYTHSDLVTCHSPASFQESQTCRAGEEQLGCESLMDLCHPKGGDKHLPPSMELVLGVSSCSSPGESRAGVVNKGSGSRGVL